MTEFTPIAGVDMPDWAIARAIGRRGTAHPFADLDGPRCALVVIDLQWAYLDPAGGYVACQAAKAAVPAVNRAAHALRAAGGLVVWVQNTHDASCARDWTVQQRMNTPESSAARNRALSEGGLGHRLWPELEVQAGDPVVLKRRYSAFTHGTCGLLELLRGRGIDTVLIAGTLTNVCCDSSARDAMQYDFRTVMLSDACAAPSAEEHSGALAAFYATFGDVMDVAMVSAILAPQAARAA